MISPKILVAIARRWQKLAAIGRRRISMSKPNCEPCNKSTPSKGHFTVSTTDGRRFAIHLAYHNSPIVQELFKLSEDEYGLPSDGPITIPCEAAFMQLQFDGESTLTWAVTINPSARRDVVNQICKQTWNAAMQTEPSRAIIHAARVTQTVAAITLENSNK
ncbi:hypothetical protein ACLOJK_002711 [Asimina triloba]